MYWTLLVLSLPTENSTARMRAWRALKASGAAVLRDGVYLLPDSEPQRDAMARIAADLQAHGGTGRLLRVEAAEAEFADLFDRRAEFAELAGQVATARTSLSAASAAEILRQARKLRRTFDQLVAIDFFAGSAQQQAAAALTDLHEQANRLLAPDEPHRQTGPLARLDAGDFRGRTWATRRRPWVDRLASAWLIRRAIDPQAHFLWLAAPADCPADAIGYDFDGARFTHVNGKVTFEILLAVFGLESPALQRVGALVHALDAGGPLPPEAAGVERVLAGMRAAILDDDQLMQAASGVFEGLLVAFEQEPAA
jgi:hypothetical protein